MTTGSILLTIALIIVLLLYLLRPFLIPTITDKPVTPQQKLQAEKEHLLDQIRALDFDHTTGKIPEEMYQTQRYRLLQQAALVAQQLDSHVADPTDMETAIETAVARLRQGQPTTITPSTNGKPSRFCPQCGQPTDPHDKFCASCGHKLQEVPG
ncbi:MAG: zinc ribbon domain-containing protein [Ardenticatenaceae bacterium]|nr:zinc ribbon domain-containing protein [Ardenticatenaceae bacterium]